VSPEQIRCSLLHIQDRLTDAYSAVDSLSVLLREAEQANPALAVVYSDIRHEVSLPKLSSDLSGLWNILDGAIPSAMERAESLTADAEPAIRTTYVHPPIPIRTSDWCACVEGQEEDGPYGWGTTEAEAIADLKEKLEDAE